MIAEATVKSVMGSVPAQTRAKYILSQRNSFSSGRSGDGQHGVPLKGISYFSF